MRLLGIAGSLRRGSYNRGLLEAARLLMPPSMAVEVFELDDIPLYHADYDVDGLRPFEVERFKTAITDADALLIATPEYNNSIPGVLPNAIDWASRPALRSPLAGKPVAIMGASDDLAGTARAQQQLTLVLMSTLAIVMPHGGMLVPQSQLKFDEHGTLTDDRTRAFLTRFLQDFEQWIVRQLPVAARR